MTMSLQGNRKKLKGHTREESPSRSHQMPLLHLQVGPEVTGTQQSLCDTYPENGHLNYSVWHLEKSPRFILASHYLEDLNFLQIEPRVEAQSSENGSFDFIIWK